jgi:ankyrin repeat protein
MAKKITILLFCGLMLIIGLPGCSRNSSYDMASVFQACKDHNVTFFELHKARLNEILTSHRPKEFSYALIVAAEQGAYNVMTFLLANGVDAKVSDWRNSNALLKMVESNTNAPVALLNELKLRGLDINSIDSQGYSALHYAAMHSSLDVLDYLVDAGAAMNATDSNGSTPLHFASTVDKANRLIKAGASLDTVNMNGETPISLAKRERAEVYDYMTKVHKAYRPLAPESTGQKF